MLHADRELPGWFPEVNRNHLIWLMYTHEVKAVLEVGAFLGKSTVFFAQRCPQVYSVDYWSIDCLTSEDEKRFAQELGLPPDFQKIWWDNLYQTRANIGFSEAFWQVLAVKPDSVDQIWVEDKPYIDLVYIDGDHSYDAVMRDIERYGPLARKIICGDDFGVAPGVTDAVQASFPDALKHAVPFWWVEL
jgi:cephalosporin hydroxylase